MNGSRTDSALSHRDQTGRRGDGGGLPGDGHKGLDKARELWPEARVQRCAMHKWTNLTKHCPRHAHRELKRDYDAIVYAEDGEVAKQAYMAFEKKWSNINPSKVNSLPEAGVDLLAFYDFPRAMRKSLRTTNSLESLNREFRRQTKP